MKTAVIRFVKAKRDLVEDVEDWWTFSRLPHCEAETESGTWIGAHLLGGVKEQAADYCNVDYQLVYGFEVEDEDYARGQALLRSTIGDEYSKRTIASLALHHDFKLRDPRQYICSWLMVDYINALGIPGKLGYTSCMNVLPQFAHLVTPETLHESMIFIGRMIHARSNFPVPKVTS